MFKSVHHRGDFNYAMYLRVLWLGLREQEKGLHKDSSGDCLVKQSFNTVGECCSGDQKHNAPIQT